MVLGVKTAEIFEKTPFEKTRKRPLESVKIKILKIGLRSDLSWPKVGLEPKFHEPGTFGGFGKREQTHKHTRFMFYKYRCECEPHRSTNFKAKNMTYIVKE